LQKLITLESLIQKRRHWRFKGLKLVWITGSFDRLHTRCVRMLQDAKRSGDILAVGVTGQESIRHRKLASWPVTPASERAELIASLECVDYGVILDNDTPEQILHRLQPDVYCLDPDRCEGSRARVADSQIVRNYGGRVLTMIIPQDRLAGVLSRDAKHKVEEDAEAIPEGELPASVLAGLVDRFSASTALVIGDVMLDEYVSGTISRISPEAPVPVLDVAARRFTCGGAANVAANMASLSGTAFLSGVIGHDQPGGTLRGRLREYGIHLDALIQSKTAQTICKTRFVAGQQQIVRVDQECHRSLTEAERTDVLDQIKHVIPQVDVCVLSDYAKGLLDERMCQDIIRLCQDQSKPTIVDPKGSNFRKYRGCSLITPNLKEAGIATGYEMRNEEDLEAAGTELLDMLPGTAILVTRGADGMTLFRVSRAPLSVPTVARKVFDVVGAGDTAVATLAVSLGAKFEIEDAIQFANIAAGIAVEQHGTVAVGIDELAARPEALQLLQSRATDYHSDTAVA
jgi:rfaE bifunctional protein kinase chain/domain/rfaE bifunctional protein nucleotidyltransferase chain/domain